MKIFGRFIIELVKKTFNIYSILSSILAIFTSLLQFLPENNFLINFLPVKFHLHLTVIFVFLIVIFACYYIWKDSLALRQQKFEIKSFPYDISFCSIDGVGMIKKYSKALFDLDFINSYDLPWVIRKIIKIECDLPSEIFDSEIDITKIKFGTANCLHDASTFPIKVEGKNRLLLKVDVDNIPVKITDPEELARNISKLKNFNLDLVFECTSPQGEIVEKTVHLETNFNNYVDSLLRMWRKDNHLNLIALTQNT